MGKFISKVLKIAVKTLNRKVVITVEDGNLSHVINIRRIYFH